MTIECISSEKQSGVCGVKEWVKPWIRISASHIGALVRILAAQFLIQFPANVLGKQQNMTVEYELKILGPYHVCGRGE